MPARRTLLLSAAATVAVLLVVVAGLWIMQQGRVLPNTSIAGIDVSRATPEEVAAAIRGPARERELEPITFTFEDDRFELIPATLGYEVDDEATVATALARGRRNPVTDVFVRIGSLWRQHDVAMVERVDRSALATAIDEIADTVDRDRFSGAVTIDPETLEVTVDRPLGAAEVRREEAVDVLAAALLSPGPDTIELPAHLEPPGIAPADVEDVAAQVEAALAAPLELHAGDETLTIEPRQLAELIEVGESDDGLSLEIRITEEAVEETLAVVAASRFDRDPVEAAYTGARTPPRSFDDMSTTSWSPVPAEIGIAEGRDGLAFDPADAAEVLTDAVREGAREATTELEVIEPELTAERAEELRPTHLLGTFTTYYTAGQVRNLNIQRLADVIDETTVLPGEQFSVNEISGDRSCSKGYHPAGTIIRGELVDTCGGGVSQFGTTTFNAAFFAGVTLDQWKAHSFYISRYPQGREATLSYPQLDVRFTNNTEGAILVRTSHTASSITVSIFGQPIARTVRAQHGQPFNFKDPQTQVRTTSSLYRGQERTIQQAGARGFTVDVVRIVERNDGGEDRRSIRTVYLPQHRIVERGTADPPEDEDEDDEDDGDEDDE